MLRRKPTRVDLTPDDVVDYEALKKQAEDLQRHQKAESKAEDTEKEQRRLEREARIGVVRRNQAHDTEDLFGRTRSGGI